MRIKISLAILYILALILIYISYMPDRNVSTDQRGINNLSYAITDDIVRIKNPRLGLLNVGHAIFGLTSNSFDCDNFFLSMQKVPEWHISFMYHSFGNNFTCLKRIFDDPRTRTVQVHLINEVSQRNGTNQWFEFTQPYSVKEYNTLWEQKDPRLLSKFSDYVKPLQKLFENYLPTRPHIQCIIGPGLESNVYDTAARNQVDASRIEFPYCKISWNGMKSTAWNADLIEDHAANNPGARPPCLINLDGEDIDFPERKSPALTDDSPWTGAVGISTLRKYIEKYANRCELYYLWTWESNCSITGAKRDPNQRNRDCSNERVKLVTRLISNEIAWNAKNAKIDPEVFNWTYDESLPLNLCSKVSNKPMIIERSGLKGLLKFPSNLSISDMYVMYKNKLIDVYTLDSLDSVKGQQIWKSTVNPSKRYPYKSILFVRVVTNAADNLSRLRCWKINDPEAKK